MNPPNGQTPLDYLNQIAPQAPKKPLFEFNLRTILIISAILVALVIIMSAVAGSIGSGKKEPWQRLNARLDSTAILADSAATNIKSSQLRSYNSDLRLYLTNTKRDLQSPLADLAIDTAKIPESVLLSESNETVAARLEDGRLNATYDSTYAREMSYLLTMLLMHLKDMYSSAGSEHRPFLEQSYNNLTPIQKGIEEFSNTTK